ncbi:hypothetical protein K3T49_23865 [Paenibacillus sonchi]|nr:hypothetical protein [Paenibacillus sonchi]
MMEQPPLEVFGTWQHAYEEDANGIAVYRPAGNSFASFQDREEIEIRQDGTFSRLVPRRSEAPDIIKGEWEQTKDQVIHVSYESPGLAPQQLEIIESKPDLLRVRKV